MLLADDLHADATQEVLYLLAPTASASDEGLFDEREIVRIHIALRIVAGLRQQSVGHLHARAAF